MYDVPGRTISKIWRDHFTNKCNALWTHDGNEGRPHALLTSGKHSNGFFNGSNVLEQARLCSRACEQMLQFLSYDLHAKEGVHKVRMLLLSQGVDRVVGSAMGGIPIGFDVARQINCKFAFTEKKDPDKKNSVMLLKRFNVSSGERVLVVEDVLTTGGTTLRTIETIENTGATTLPYILVFVNRSGLTEIGGKKVFSLVDLDIKSWEAPDCPLCKQGSQVVRPKENWDKLTMDLPTR